MQRILVLGLAVVLLWVSPVPAGIGAGNGEIGFDFGFTNYDSNTSEDDAGHLPFRGGYFMTDLFQIEGELAASVARTETPQGDIDTILRTILVNMVFNFHPSDHIVPYVLGGIGHANLEFDGFGQSIDDDSFAYQIAGGSRFFFGKKKRVAVRVELGFLGEETFNASSTHTSLTAGFTWRIGAE